MNLPNPGCAAIRDFFNHTSQVDKNDPSFQKPSKPIGPFYDKEEAEAAMAKTGVSIKKMPDGATEKWFLLRCHKKSSKKT